MKAAARRRRMGLARPLPAAAPMTHTMSGPVLPVVAFLLACAAGGATVAQAAASPYGASACGVVLQVAGAPRLGTTIQLVGTGSLRFGTRLIPNWLMLGISAGQAGGQPLPVPMATLMPSPLSCGELLQSADLFVLMPEAPSLQLPTVSIPVAIPAQPALVGVTVYLQTAQLAQCLGNCPIPVPDGLIASNGVMVRFGW